MAQRQHELADPQPVRVAEAQRGQISHALDAEHGEIDPVVTPDHLRREASAVVEPHLGRRHAVDHVGIGDDHAVRVDDEAGALAAPRLVEIALLLRPVAPDAHVHERRLQAISQPGQQVVEARELRRDRRRRGAVGAERARATGDERSSEQRDERRA
jgi:hypothetical protein